MHSHQSDYQLRMIANKTKVVIMPYVLNAAQTKLKCSICFKYATSTYVIA